MDGKVRSEEPSRTLHLPTHYHLRDRASGAAYCTAHIHIHIHVKLVVRSRLACDVCEQRLCHTSALCFGERYECTRIPFHMPVALSQALCPYETRCGFLPHLAPCSTLIVHGCPASGSSSSLQLGGRVAQSASVAPTTKCAERAAVVPKCVVNKGFDGNNNG